MELISLAALKGAVVSMLEELGRVLLRILALVSVMAIFWPLLPNDPFKGSILAYAPIAKNAYHWINWVVDVPTLVTIVAFYAMWRYFYWAYRKLGGILLNTSTGEVFGG